MKINDIIVEAISAEDSAKLTTLQGRGGKSQKLAAKMKPYLDAGYEWDVASEIARDEIAAQSKPDVKPAQTPPTAKTPRPEKTPRPASTPDDQRARQDTMGRNLRHDRYYRDKDTFDYSDNMFGDDPMTTIDKITDKIPGVKTAKKAARDGSVHVNRGRDVGRKIMNFDDKQSIKKR
jgi:hypothetical protein